MGRFFQLFILTLYNIYAWILLIFIIIGSLIGTRLMLLVVKRNWEALYFKVVGRFVSIWGRLVGIPFRVNPNNRQLLEAGQAYVITGNHISFLDLHAIAVGIPAAFKPLSKVQNTRIPILGPLIRKAVISVDRSSPESREESMQRMKETVARGVSVLVFPEGGRNRVLDQPLRERFYDGAFRIAIEHQIPVIPLVITGTRNTLPTGKLLFKPGPIGIHLLSPIPTLGMTDQDTESLKQIAYKAMESQILALDPYFNPSK